jgi:pimeloyl-ACP methyl ester carboxylesterase
LRREQRDAPLPERGGGAVRRRLGLVGAIAGGVAGATAVSAYAVQRRISSKRKVSLDTLASEPCDRQGIVAAEDGVGLHYQEVGPTDAALTVIFVHGFCLSHRAFVLQRRALRARFGDDVRTVFYDHRSHGRSERSDPARATIDQLGRDLHRVIETLAPQRRLALVGHSMGGMTVLALADGFPELFRGPQRRVDAVVLLSTSTGKLATVTLGLPSLIARVRGPVFPLLLRGARQRAEFVERGRRIGTDVTWLLTRWFSFGGEVPPEIVEFATDMIAGTRIETIADFYSALMEHDKLRALDNLDECAVLIICGDKDVLTPLDHSRAMADALPAARFVVVPEAGHLAMLGAPDEVSEPIAELLADTLAALPERRSA